MQSWFGVPCPNMAFLLYQISLLSMGKIQIDQRKSLDIPPPYQANSLHHFWIQVKHEIPYIKASLG